MCVCVSFLEILHEHSRIDRDDYVDISWKNITKAAEEDQLPRWKKARMIRNYNKCDTTKHGCKSIESKYDFSSILHYKPTMTTVNGNRFTVITPKGNACANKMCDMGQRKQLSPLDIQDINDHYDCVPKGKKNMHKISLLIWLISENSAPIL